jgi:hypothetical protein
MKPGPDRDYQIEIDVAKAVYGHDVEMLDTLGLGLFTPHFVGDNIIGATECRAKRPTGEIVDMVSRPVLAYSIRLDDAWTLLEYLRVEHFVGRDKDGHWPNIVAKMGMQLNLFSMDSNELATCICQVILSVLTDYEF